MIVDYQKNNVKEKVLLEEMKKITDFPVHTKKFPEVIQNIENVQDTLKSQEFGTFEI